MLRRLLLLALMGALLVGCAKATPWPGHGPEGESGTKAPVNAPNATTPAQSTKPVTSPPTTSQPATNTPPVQPLPADGSLPGDSKALEGALSAPSHLRYKIEVVTDPVEDPAKYLDDRIAQGSAPGPNELLFILFATKNYDIRFAMGPMEPPLSPENVYAKVRAIYLSKKGNPAGAMAELITALNQ